MTDSVPTVPSPAASYSEQRTQSIVAHRNHVRIAPKYGGDFRAGSTIRLEIPSQDWLDPDLFSISFLAKIFRKDGYCISPYGDAYGGYPRDGYENLGARFDTPIQTVFNRIKLLQGSTVIEDIQDYGTLMKILTLSTVNKQYMSTLGGSFEGMYDVTDYQQLKDAKQRHAYGKSYAVTDTAGNEPALNNGWYYNIKPLLGLFRAGKYVPLKWMGQLTIELYCEQNAACLISSTTVLTNATVDDTVYPPTSDIAVGDLSSKLSDYDGAYYELSDINMECHFVQPIEEYDKSALAMIESKGLEIWFDTFSTHVKQVTGAGRFTNSFQERAVSLKGGYAVMQNSSDLNDYRTPIVFADNQIQEYQWKIGSHYVPAQPVKTILGASTALAELQASFDAYGDMITTGTIEADNFTGRRYTTDAGITGEETTGITLQPQEIQAQSSLPNSFIMALNLEKSPDQLSGFNSAAASVDVELTLNTKAANDVSLNVGIGGRDASVLSAGHIFQPSKYLLHHYYNNGRLIAASSSSDYRDDPFNPSRVLEMFTKPPSKYCRLTFFAHLDSVLKVDRVGSVSIMR